MRAPRKDALERREKIIDAAEVAFARWGYDVPLDEICKLADVGRATLYRNFASRLALVHAIMTRNIEILDRVEGEVGDAPRGLFGFIEEVARQLVKTGGVVYLIGEDPKLDRELAERFRSALARLIVTARQRGEIRADVDVDEVAMVVDMIWGGLEKHSYDERQVRAPAVLKLAFAALKP